jgi:pentose-5-phosphate-3-epimerase
LLQVLQADGGISEATAPLAATAGANALVAGSALFCSAKELPVAFEALEGALLEHGS